MNSKSLSLNILNKKEDVFIFFYFILLGILTFFLTRPNVNVGILTRIVYLVAIVIPAFKSLKWLPFAVTTFYSISMCSFSPLLPSKIYILILIVLIPVLMGNKLKIKGRMSLFFILLYFFLIDLLHLEIQELLFTSVILAFICVNCIDDEEGLGLLALSFIFVSVILSLLFLSNYEAFLQQYGGRFDDMERSGWINPNIFGGHLSIGFVLAFWMLLETRKNAVKFLLVAVIILTAIALILNASRGSFVATTIPVVLLTLFSGIKSRYKVLVVIVGVALLMIAATNGYFDLLQYRFTDETVNSGGYRLDIWNNKINEFFKNPSVGGFIFGLGQNGCENLGLIGRTHNDFVTSFIAYGLIGLILFVIIFFRPLYLSKGKKRPAVETVSFYLLLIIECLVLEPLFRGYFIYFMFYLFIAKFLEQSNLQQSIK